MEKLKIISKILGWIQIISACAVFFCLGGCHGHMYAKKQAVRAGVGMFTNNPTTGKEQFMWITPTNLVPEQPVIQIRIN